MFLEPESLKYIGVDKTGSSWYVSYDHPSPEDFWMIFHAWSADKPPRLHPRWCVMASVLVRDTRLSPMQSARLIDIRTETSLENRGGATLVLRYAESWCRSMGCREIWGELSDVDSDHLDKLKHFYEKNGYTFKLFVSGDPEYNPQSLVVGEVRKEL